MAITYTTAAKNARMNATMDHFANGTLEIIDSGTTVLATFGFNAAGGSVTGAVWTIVFDSNSVAATAAGTANHAVIKTSGGTPDITGLTVGTSASDIIIDNLNIANGQNITISSAAITHAA